jgi:hypothetical protein
MCVSFLYFPRRVFYLEGNQCKFFRVSIHLVYQIFFEEKLPNNSEKLSLSKWVYKIYQAFKKKQVDYHLTLNYFLKKKLVYVVIIVLIKP